MTSDGCPANPSVLNTTVLSNFAYIDQLWVVAELSGSCTVPVVREELEHGVGDHPYLQSALDALDDEIPVAAISTTITNRAAVVSDHLDPGEAQAFAVADVEDGRLLTDDGDARSFAKNQGVTVVGSVGVLLAAIDAVETECDVIVFEDLTDIRERLPEAKWHHIWAFRRLFEYVEYKAPEKGISVEQVEPNHTSQRCSRMGCGFTHEDNRHGEQFECQKCGYEVNADYNGAKNVGLRYARKRQHRLRSSPKSESGDAPVDVRVNGGTLNGESHRPIAGA